jgi:2-polyprenyl-3-methyl-5-hydroxy-6-metoxy-1,4-benzoquinol methylase
VLTKQAAKQLVRRTIGEPYVWKRLKLRWLAHRLPDTDPRAILDFGSEDATFTYWLADRFPEARVTAVDIDDAAMAACRAAQPAGYKDRIEFKTADLGDLPESSFDLATAFDVLEHIVDDADALQRLGTRVRPGGLVLIHVPERTFVDHRGRVHTGTDDMAWQINPGHVRLGYTPDQVAALCERAGLEVALIERWNRRWSARAVALYGVFEHPAPLRLLTIPFTDVCAWLDRRRPPEEGNTVFAIARRPSPADDSGQ